MLARMLPVVALLVACFSAPVCAAQRINWDIRSSLDGDFVPPGADEQTTCVVADFNGDGIDEIVMSDRTTSPSLVLFQYSAGTDSWVRFSINATPLTIEAGGAVHDIDGDGDLDIALGSDFQSSNVWWWENPGEAQWASTSQWPRRLIKNTSGNYHHDQAFGDFDGDGAVEFATWVQVNTSARRLRIYEIPADPKATQPWPTFVALTIPVNEFVEGCEAHDVDRDGKTDILAGGRWYRHQSGNGSGAVYTSTAIDATYPGSRITAADIVPGGYLEVLLCSGDAVGDWNYYQWDGTQWCKTLLVPTMVHGHSQQIGDIDKDGHLDIFAAEMGNPGAGANCRAIIGWGDSLGNFQFETISVGRANHMSRLGHLNDDDRLDIVMKPFKYEAPRLDVFLNQPAPLPINQFSARILVDNLPWQPLNLLYADVDGDGLLDMISGGWWFENPGTVSGTWTRRTVGGNLNNVLIINDWDCDGDIDFLGTEGMLTPINAADNNNEFHYGRNDGSGNFTVTAAGSSGFAGNVFPQGFTGGQLQPGEEFSALIGWNGSEINNIGVQRIVPPAGGPSSGPWAFSFIHPISEGEQMTLGDINRDGLVDIFQGTGWLRNNGPGYTRFEITPSLANTNGTPDRDRLFDMDQDGDLDAIVGFSHAPGDAPNDVLWFEQPADPEQLWTQHTIGTNVGGGFSMDVGDIDHDGDVDVLLGEHMGATRLLIFENLDGVGTSWAQRVVDAGNPSVIDHHLGSQLVDLDGDGDRDIMSIGWFNDKIWVYENLAMSGTSGPAPDAPANVVAEQTGQRQIGVNWDDNSGTVSGYNVYRGTAPGFSPSSGTLLGFTTDSCYLDEALPAGSTFYYIVRAVDGSSIESPDSAEDSATLVDTYPPVLLSAHAISATEIVLEFNEALLAGTATDASGYFVDGIQASSAAYDGATTVTLTTAPLLAGQSYPVLSDSVQDLLGNGPTAQTRVVTSGSGVEACLPFDEGAGATAFDVTTNNHDGTLSSPDWSTDTADGSPFSLRFGEGGSNDTVTLAPFDVPGSAITLSAWFKVNAFDIQDGRILSKAIGNGASDHFWMLSTIFSNGAHRLRVRLRTGGVTDTLIPTGAPLVTGQWYHCAATYDGVTLRLYQDGVQIASMPKSGALDQAPAVGVAIGNQPTVASDRPWNGWIDQVAVHARALPASEIAAIVAASSAPTAVADTGQVPLGGATVIQLAANDLPAAEIDPNTIQIDVQPLHGMLTIGSGSVTYNHAGLSNEADDFVYRIRNNDGLLSNPAKVVVTLNGCAPPVAFTQQPVGTTLCEGGNVTLSVAATGLAPLSYQWRLNGTNIAGATGASLMINGIAVSDAGAYDCVVTNPCGSLASDEAQVALFPVLTIVGQPMDVVTCLNATATFMVQAQGQGTLTYQWNLGGVPIAGATTSQYQIVGVQPADLGSYTCAISDFCSATVSAPATLSVGAVTMVTQDPVDVTVCPGSTAVFTANGTGAAPVTFQWLFDGTPIPGATSTTLTIASVMAADVGSYALEVTGLCGTPVTSTPANLALVMGLDCNSNGVADTCDISGGTSEDCNTNGIPDSCDITNGVADLNSNGIPDSCEPDCNNNDIPDDLDIGTISLDCNNNDVPDECDIGTVSNDVNSNGIPDECEDDCNTNGIPDAYEIGQATTPDCNLNGIPDSCDIASNTELDCNFNGVPDSCDIANATSTDTNMNMIPDECDVDPTLIAHWKLDEGAGTVAADDANNNTGTQRGGLGWDGPSEDGSPFYGVFDGVDDAIDINSNLDVPGNELTLACWFRADDFDVKDGRLISKASGTAGNAHLWMLSTIGVPSPTPSDFFLRFRLKTGAAASPTTTLIATSGALTPGVWTHAVAVYDGSTMTLYKDGVVVGSVAQTGPIVVNPAVGLAIGNQPVGAGPRAFDGCIDDVRVYDRALTAQEIQGLATGALPPITGPESYTFDEDEAGVVAAAQGVLVNDSDPNRGMLTAQLAGSPANAAVFQLFPDGGFLYTPNADFNGADSFSYQARDPQGLLSAPRTVPITILPLPDAPVAVADLATTDEDVPVVIDVTVNDFDVDGDPITPVLDSQPANGFAAVVAGGIEYTPNLEYSGPDSFTYHVNDGGLDSAIVTVSIVVNDVIDPVIAQPDFYFTNEDLPFIASGLTPGVLANDLDPNQPPVPSVTANLVTDVTNGTLTLNSDGTFEYAPAPDFFGEDSFFYEAFNGVVASAAVKVTINVAAQQDVPVAVADSYMMNENTTFTLAAPGILVNDSDADGDPLTAVVQSPLSGGTVGSDGSISYTPPMNFNGTVTFTYAASDGITPVSNIVTVSILVADVILPPVAVADQFTTDEDVPLMDDVLFNDSDPQSLPITAILVSDVSDGNLTLLPDGTFTYTPDLNFNGTDSFTYRAENTAAMSSPPVTVMLTVNPINDAPVAVGDMYQTNEDTQLVVAAPGVLNGDSDVDLDPLTVSLLAPAMNGVVALNADGSFTYTPALNYNGPDSFQYNLLDGTAPGVPATVNITVNAVVDAPVALADSYSTAEDTALVVPAPGVGGNDMDTDGNGFSVALVSGPANGSLTLNPDGSFDYDPNPNYFGPDSFDYTASNGATSAPATVTIDVISVLDPPFAVADMLSVTRGTTLTQLNPALGLLANDQNVEGGVGALTATLDSPASAGQATVNPDGTFSYMHFGGPGNVDSFTYLATGPGGTSVGTVSVSIQDANLGLIAHWEFDEGTGTSAADSAGSRDGTLQSGAGWDGPSVDTSPNYLLLDGSNDYVNIPSTLDVPGNAVTIACWFKADDFGVVDGRLLSKASGAGGNTHYLMLSTMQLPYNTPGGLFHLRFRLKTGSVATPTTTLVGTGNTLTAGQWIHAAAVYDGTTMRLYQDGVEVGSLAQTGNIVVNPAIPTAIGNQPLGAGSRPFDGCIDDMRVYDRALTPTEIMGLAAVPAAPIALPDSYSVAEDDVLTVPAITGVLLNDTDPNGDPILAVLDTPASSGAVTLLPSGEFTYTPNADFFGTDTFLYRATDTLADSAPTVVTITVSNVPDAPVAVDDSASGDEDVALVVAAPGVLTNDSDADGDPLTAVLVTGPMNGGVVLNPDGSYTYTPNPDFSGSDSFTYTANDSGPSAPATVMITINDVPEPPTAVADVASTDEDVQLVGTSVLTNDMDGNIPALPLTAQLESDVTNGVLNLAPDGTFTYTPAPDFNGQDVFTYRAFNGFAPSNVAMVEINVAPIADLPVAVDDSYMTDEDTALVVGAPGVLANDLDADGDSLTAMMPVGPSSGNLTLNPDGSFSYTPNPGFVGTDQFTYVANDGLGSSTPATVTIQVVDVIEAPVVNADAYAVDEDQVLTENVGVLDNDSDPQGLPLTVTVDDDVDNGVLVLASDGTFVYTPNLNFFGSDSFTYIATNGTTPSVPAMVTITVNSVNDIPVALPDAYSTDEDVPLVIAAGLGLLANDSDLDGPAALTPMAPTLTTNGAIVVNPDGSFTYTPNLNFSGVDSFVYTAFDGAASSAPAVVTITVIPLSDAPIAVDNSYVVSEDSVLDISADPPFGLGDTVGVLFNDVNVEGTPMVALLVSDVSNGTLTLDLDGSFIYVPDANFNGSDSFTYQANNGLPSNTATAFITVLSVPDAPVANDDSYAIDGGGTLTITVPALGVLGNDSDADGDVLTAQVATPPTDGALTLNADGTFTYVHNGAGNPTDTFTYEVLGGGSPAFGTVTIQISSLSQGLFAHWKFDENGGSTALDSAGPNNGAITGAVHSPLTNDGSVSKLSFDGDDRVGLGTMDVPAGNALSFAFWMRANAFSPVDVRFISKASSTASNDHWWMVSSIRDPFSNLGAPIYPRFRLKTGSTTTTLVGNAPAGVLSTGVWTHIAAVYDGSTMRLFKDGVQIGSVAKTGTVATNSAVDATIGNQPVGAGAKGFDGCLDDMRIYSRALSAAEIAQLAQVAGANVAPTIDSSPVTTATVGVEYSYDVDASDPDFGDLVAYSLSANPAGASINAGTGLITWTPAAPESAMFTVVATDLGGLTDMQSFTVNALPPGNPPQFDSTPFGTAYLQPPAGPTAPANPPTPEVEYSYTAQVSDLDGDAVTLALTTGPAGATLDSEGWLQWTPTAADLGSHLFVLTATDATGLSSTQVFNVVVVNAPALDGGLFRVNCGGPTFTSSATGDVWEADTLAAPMYSQNGNVFVDPTPVPIANSLDDFLFDSERWINAANTPLVYSFPVGTPGVYMVRLHFAETFWTAAGQRVFDVSAEGNDLLKDFDIQGAATATGLPGLNRAVAREFFVNTDDGNLVIEFFHGLADNPKVSAIEVFGLNEME